MTDNHGGEMEMENVFMLTDETGRDVPFAFLDLIEYEGAEFVVLYPMNEEDDNGEVVILQVAQDADDEEVYVGIESEELLLAVFEAFREKNADQFSFEDGE